MADIDKEPDFHADLEKIFEGGGNKKRFCIKSFFQTGRFHFSNRPGLVGYRFLYVSYTNYSNKYDKVLNNLNF